MNTQERLKQYVEEDSIYNDYLNGKTNISDFDKFCIQHCKDIKEILNENKNQKEVIDKIYTIINYEKDFYDTKEELVSDLERLLKNETL